MAVRAITFDFWSTLFRDANGAARQQIRIDAFAEATGLPAQTVADALRVTWAEFERHHKELHRTLTPLDAVHFTANTLGIALAPDTAQRLADVFTGAILAHAPEPIEGALEAVRAAANVAAVGLISDTGVSVGASLRTLLERGGFLPYLRVLAFSDEVRVSKPEPEMFQAAVTGLGVPPEELLHIGDLEYTDVAGARAFGAQAALFAGENAVYLKDTQADHVFRSWPEFIAALPALCAAS